VISEKTARQHKCLRCGRNIHSICGVVRKKADEVDKENEAKVLCLLCFEKENTVAGRKNAKENLEKQSKKMKKDSDTKFPPISLGFTIRILVPDIDKGRGDAGNILAIIMRVTEDGFYQLGTTKGILKQLYARSQFTLCQKTFLSVEDVPHEEISLRTVATLKSTGSGQGFIKCTCKGKCHNWKCFCVGGNMLCNSKYHSCCNK
jgi:hypothetical protein